MNAEITMFIGADRDKRDRVRPIYRLAPFAWIWMLVPICGIVGFYVSILDAEKEYERLKK